MKTIYIIATLCLSLIAFSQIPKLTNVVYANLSWDGRHCRGLNGPCDMNIVNNKAMGSTTISYDSNGNLTFCFERAKITKAMESKILGVQLAENSKVVKITNVMEDDIDLNANLKSALNTASSYTKIPKGNYQVQISKDVLSISFKLE